MERKILVFGANGQVGREIIGKVPEIAVGFDRSAVDICVEADVDRAVRDHPTAAMVNAAAYTAVDGAEAESQEALSVNRDGAAVLARAATAVGVPLIHLSTDYVFDGTKRTPYGEDDPVAPLGVYGLSKAEGERAVREICPRHLILRTAWVYSPFGTNFVRTMLRLAAERPELQIVNDQTGCPTAAADIAATMIAVLTKACQPGFTEWGTYHYRGGDVVTWYAFASLIFEVATRYGQKAPRLVPISTVDYPTPALRPAYSVLAVDKVERVFGIRSRPLSESLRECLDTLLLRS
jgi:dTDP-4-dehydrorhamnose reductase